MRLRAVPDPAPPVTVLRDPRLPFGRGEGKDPVEMLRRGGVSRVIVPEYEGGIALMRELLLSRGTEDAAQGAQLQLGFLAAPLESRSHLFVPPMLPGARALAATASGLTGSAASCWRAHCVGHAALGHGGSAPVDEAIRIREEPRLRPLRCRLPSGYANDSALPRAGRPARPESAYPCRWRAARL